jgi:hypothetical protein
MSDVDEATIAAFWDRIDRSGGPDACWPWCDRWGFRNGPYKYGRLSLPGGKQILAHRLAYELAHGPIPPGHVIRHRCDNPPCCNPAHLLSGTHGDNVRDMFSRGRGRGQKK